MTSTDAAGQTTTYTYTANNQIQTIVAPPHGGLSEAERTTTYAYNGDGQLTSTTVDGATTSYEYDGYGRVWTVTDSDGYTITKEYDALDRPTRTISPDGTYRETVYERLDPVKRRDRMGRWTQMFYDSLGRVVATRDPDGSMTSKNEWASCGSGCSGGAKLSKLTDSSGNTTTWEYDLQGRITKEIRPDGTFNEYAYEATTSRLKQVTDAKGQIRAIEYYRDNKQKQVTHSNAEHSTPNVSFTYDPVYNRLVSTTDGTGTTNFTYYPVGVLGAGRIRTVDGPLGNDVLEYGYDEVGRVASRTINGSANAETWAYDARGRISSITNPLGAFGYSYEGATGRMASATYPNGQQTTYAYLDNLGDHRLQEIHNKKPGGATLSKFNYTYDKAGNILTWRQQTEAQPAKVYEFGYDNADQLTAAILKSTDPTPVTLKRYYYGYDGVGNRLAEQIDDSVKSWAYNNMNQLVTEQAGGALIFKGTVTEPATVTVGGKAANVTADNRFAGSAVVPSGTQDVQVVATDYASPTRNTRTNTYRVTQSGGGKSFTFDAYGNMSGDGVRVFEWDARNRLTAITAGTHRSELNYDGYSRLARDTEKDNGVSTTDIAYVWCGLSLCEERDAQGGTVTKKVFERGVQVGGTAYFFTTDHLGSVRDVTDASGTVVSHYDFDPYGRRARQGTGPDVADGFTGHAIHGPTGLTMAPYRVYDADLGRWLSRDPIGMPDGPNVYRYATGNPIGRVDPLGLLPTVVCNRSDVPGNRAYLCCENGHFAVCMTPAGDADLSNSQVRDCVAEHEELHSKIHRKKLRCGKKECCGAPCQGYDPQQYDDSPEEECYLLWWQYRCYDKVTDSGEREKRRRNLQTGAQDVYKCKTTNEPWGPQ